MIVGIVMFCAIIMMLYSKNMMVLMIFVRLFMLVLVKIWLNLRLRVRKLPLGMVAIVQDQIVMTVLGRIVVLIHRVAFGRLIAINLLRNGTVLLRLNLLSRTLL